MWDWYTYDPDVVKRAVSYYVMHEDYNPKTVSFGFIVFLTFSSGR